jgi:hypothetical protein
VGIRRRRRQRSGQRNPIEEDVDGIADRFGNPTGFDNAAGDRFGRQPDRTREAVNERIDDFTGNEAGRQNRYPDAPTGR